MTTTEHPGLTIITETLVTMTTSAIAGAETYARRVGTKGAWEAVVALKAALYDLSVATSWYHYDVLRESR